MYESDVGFRRIIVYGIRTLHNFQSGSIIWKSQNICLQLCAMVMVQFIACGREMFYKELFHTLEIFTEYCDVIYFHKLNRLEANVCTEFYRERTDECSCGQIIGKQC